MTVVLMVDSFDANMSNYIGWWATFLACGLGIPV